MASKDRQILLLLDNCSAHDIGKLPIYSNITIKYLPPNTTPKLQPMDRGIIRAFKAYFKSQLLSFLIAKIEINDMNASEAVKRISPIDALMWTKLVWDKVTAQTIINCYKHAGFPLEEAEISIENDVEAELVNVSSLIAKMGENTCDVENYLCCDDGLPTEEVRDDWEEQLIEQFIREEGDTDTDIEIEVIEEEYAQVLTKKDATLGIDNFLNPLMTELGSRGQNDLKFRYVMALTLIRIK
jgi:hypothetical protein